MELVKKQPTGIQQFFQSGFVRNFSPRQLLGGILLIALLTRIYICFFTSLPHIHRDSIDYFKQAETLLAGGYTDYFPNGYPAIIALLKAITGAQVNNAALLLNILLGTITVYFVYGIARKVFALESIAITAALLVALFPSQINLTRWLTSEVPVTFFLTGGYFLYLKKQYWLSGLLFGIGVTIRTEVQFIFLLLIFLELIAFKKFNWKALLTFAIPLLIIGFYCQSKTGKFSTSGHGMVNIMLSVTAMGPNVDWTYIDKHPEITTTKQAVDHYIAHAKADPGLFVKQRLLSVWELWSFLPSSDVERGQASRIILGLENIFMIFFGLYAAWKNRKKFRSNILLIPFLIVTPLHAMLYSNARYTFPVVPFMVILCSWTIWKLLSDKSKTTDSIKN